MKELKKFLETKQNSKFTDFYDVKPGVQKLPFLVDNGYGDWKKINVQVDVEKVSNKDDGTMIYLRDKGKWCYNKSDGAFKAYDPVALEICDNQGKNLGVK